MISLAEIHWGRGEYWWVLLVPLLVGGVLHAWAWVFRRRVSRSFPGRRLVPAMVQGRSTWRRVVNATLIVLGLELLAVAWLRPRYGLREVTIRGVGVDIAVVLDASRSMKAADVAPDRLTAAGIEIARILDGMRGNRVALVPFAGLAFVQTPLTLDYEVVKEYLAALKVTDLPVPGTALGRALRVAATALGVESGPAKRGSAQKVILVFTDGENHEGEPEKVAEELAGRGVRVFTVGVGTPAGQPVPILDEQGQVVGTAREKDGVTPVLSKLNEELLKTIAAKTGGRYYSLTSVGGVADDVLKDLAAVEKSEYQTRVEQLLEDRFQYPLAAGIALLMLAFLLIGGTSRRARAATAMVALVLFAAPPAQARGFFERAHPGVEEALALIRDGQAGDAAKALKELADQMPGRADLLYDLALAQDAAGQHPEAASTLDQALAALAQAKEAHPDWPTRPRLLHAKGTILMHQAREMEEQKKPAREVRGVWRQAVEALAEALVQDPDAEDTRRNLELCAMAAFPPCSKLDDAHEPNETPREAPFLTPDPNTLTVHEDLMLCPDNLDYFRLPVRPAETLIARVLEPSGESSGGAAGPAADRPAAVDLTLLDSSERELAATGKQARFTARDATDLIFKVSGPKQEDGIPYVLDVRIIPACPTGDDALEDNDTREAARAVEDGDHSLRICPGDDDWFHYTEKQGTQKEVAIEVPASEGPLELEVFSADGAPMDVTRTAADQGGVVLSARLPKAEQEAPFLIRVFGGGNQGFYNLAIRDPRGGGANQPKQDQPQNQSQNQNQPERSAQGRTMRDQLEAIDRNEENLEAKEAERQFPTREYVPEKDW